jgi:hypothetical protein
VDEAAEPRTAADVENQVRRDVRMMPGKGSPRTAGATAIAATETGRQRVSRTQAVERRNASRWLPEGQEAWPEELRRRDPSATPVGVEVSDEMIAAEGCATGTGGD